MKKIAVLLHCLTVEYSINVLNGIAEFFNDKNDCQLIIGQLKNPHTNIGVYEYQCWSAKSLLLSDETDAVIIVTGSFSATMEYEELQELLKDFAKKKPVVSIGVDLKIKNSYHTHVDCKSAYIEVIKHLKDHNCTRIAYMGADNGKSIEAIERFEAYKEGLKANGLEFDEDLQMNASFTKSTAYAEFTKNYKSKKAVNFDAIMAANDSMALGCMQAIQELGLKIPDDIKVFGFDESTFAAMAVPRLSTIDQNITNQGYEGAEMMYSILEGKTIPVKREIPIMPVYRQSCGCIPLENNFDVFMTSSGRIVSANQKTQEQNNRNGNSNLFLTHMDRVYNLFDIVTASDTMEKFFNILPFLMQVADISAMAVCLYKQPITLKQEDDFILPSKVTLSMFINSKNDTKLFNTSTTWNPKKNLFPKKLFTGFSGNFIIQPVFSGEVNYGYMICSISNKTFSIYSIFLRIMVNSLTQAYEMTSSIHQNEILSEQNHLLRKNNSSLDIQSKTDELTKILNRRGFMELAERTIGIAIEMESEGLVFFIDMDGLKKINDTYGHKMGDRAIKAMATVLTKVLRANDVVGRLSGDEFAAVTVGMKLTQVEKIRSKIKKYCEQITAEKEFPFQLSCSIGAVEFNSQKKNLKSLLIAADKKLYIEKHKKHQVLKQNSKIQKDLNTK